MINTSPTQPMAASPDYAKTLTGPTALAENESRPAIRQSPLLRRLVVLVPDANIDQGRLAAKLWSMASVQELSIILVGLVRDAFCEARAQRRLAAIAAITRDKRTHVETRVSIGTRWEPLIQSVWQDGDLLVCHAEQNRSVFVIRREPLAAALASKLKIPVYAVSGFCPALPPDWPEWVSGVLTVLPLAVFLSGFLVALVGIQRFTTGPAQPVLLCLSVVIEYGLIAAWETFINRSLD